MKQRILITGASGFVGKALVAKLAMSEEKLPVALLRHGSVFSETKQNMERFHFSDFHDHESLEKALKNIDCVVHCAARVHMMNETDADPLEAFRRVNTQGTLNLAALAAKQGVRRFIYLSSIKTLGEETLPGRAFRYHDTLNPQDAYGISKAEAEAALTKLAADTEMELVIIRPPLVYGPGVKANFASLMKLARRNLPLPLGAIRNKRSMVSLDNLVDLIETCINHPLAANQVFLVSDDHDVSTTELLETMTRAAGKKPRLLPVPMKVIEKLAQLLGKSAIADRLCGSLQVDISHTKETLGWKPPVSFEEGIKRSMGSGPIEVGA
jgi:nucleoside-diphosphate-sugar epimerase